MERLDEPQRGGTPYDKVKRSRSSAAPTELLIFVSPVYPGFHFGLCPHSTLGYAGVSCLKTVAGLKKDKFLLVLLWSFAECGNHKALRLKATGVYSCK